MITNYMDKLKVRIFINLNYMYVSNCSRCFWFVFFSSHWQPSINCTDKHLLVDSEPLTFCKNPYVSKASAAQTKLFSDFCGNWGSLRLIPGPPVFCDRSEKVHAIT